MPFKFYKLEEAIKACDAGQKHSKDFLSEKSMKDYLQTLKRNGAKNIETSQSRDGFGQAIWTIKWD